MKIKLSFIRIKDLNMFPPENLYLRGKCGLKYESEQLRWDNLCQIKRLQPILYNIFERNCSVIWFKQKVQVIYKSTKFQPVHVDQICNDSIKTSCKLVTIYAHIHKL